MKEKLFKFKDDSKKMGMPEAAVYLLKKFQAHVDDINALLNRSMQHMSMACDTVTTTGGSTTEEFLNVAIKSGMHCTVTLNELGANPVTVLAARCEMGKVVVTFSADPSNDHKLTYNICK